MMTYSMAMVELVSEYNRAVVHMWRAKHDGTFGLVLGSGFSEEFGLPLWQKLINEIAKDPQINGADLDVDKETPHKSRSDLLFQHFKEQHYDSCNKLPTQPNRIQREAKSGIRLLERPVNMRNIITFTRIIAFTGTCHFSPVINLTLPLHIKGKMPCPRSLRNIITFTGIIAFSLLIGGISHADERIDLIYEGKKLVNSPGSSFILEASWETADPFGEFDSSLGAAAALNRALGLVFTGHASHSQIEMQQRMALEPGNSSYKMAPFALEVLDVLQTDWEESFPEPVELKPFDLQPSEIPELLAGDPNILALRYFDEEYLERLLQRLYFKLIQGPVLLTVPYQADAPNVPDEYKDWNNFRYDNNTDTMIWDDTRYVWIDWDLTQTVVLMYEDGRIACYDSGRKYYIDHTAAITAAGAMLAHPDYDELPEGTSLSFVLAIVE